MLILHIIANSQPPHKSTQLQKIKPTKNWELKIIDSYKNQKLQNKATTKIGSQLQKNLKELKKYETKNSWEKKNSVVNKNLRAKKL